MKYKYDLIYSARKSISVSISETNQITVRAPWGVGKTDIERFLDEKAVWIENNVFNNSLKLARNDDVIEYRKIYINGKKIPLTTDAAFGCITPDGVFAKNIKDIKTVLCKEFSDEFIARTDNFAKKANLSYSGLDFKDYSGRWGCCNSYNYLIFNYRIFMLPENLQNYIIIHELCHTLCKNHSPAFWTLVGEFVPDYKSLKTQLHYYDFLTMLY